MSILKKENPPKQVLIQLLLALPVSLVIFGVLALILLIGFEVAYADRIYPGVIVDEIDLSGMSFEEAKQHLAETLPYTYEGRLQFTYEDRVWAARPIDLGYLVEPTASTERAFDVGRGGWLLPDLIEKGRAWFRGVQLSPIAFYDERIALNYLQSIADEIDQPMVEASLRLENTQVVVESGQVGREVDIPGTLFLLNPIFSQMEDAVIPLIVTETSPTILDVSAQAELARQMLSEPLVVTASDVDVEENSWTIPPEELASMLIISRIDDEEMDDASYQVILHQELFQVYLNGLAPGLSVTPVNPRFIFNDDTGLLDVMEPAVIGRRLDVEASIDHFNQRLKAGEHQVSLQFETLEPAVTDDMSGEELGITELVQQETSYFYGSDSARVQNIETASAQFHGLLIPPGKTFSMADALGNISLENGYAEALIIYGDQTIQGVGGGVCQVSTTLFRTAFFAGFPIVERHAHAYRVSYYEQRANGNRDSNLAGLDATVYVPIVDLKFINDTDHWLLMETYMGNYSLTWKFYSTSDGRTVDWHTTGPTNIVPAPDPIYRENPDLEKGEIEQVDYAADGAEISVTRTVYKDDKVLFSDAFHTKFRPWQAIFEYGPGTEDIPETESE